MFTYVILLLKYSGNLYGGVRIGTQCAASHTKSQYPVWANYFSKFQLKFTHPPSKGYPLWLKVKRHYVGIVYKNYNTMQLQLINLFPIAIYWSYFSNAYINYICIFWMYRYVNLYCTSEYFLDMFVVPALLFMHLRNAVGQYSNFLV